MDCTVGLLQRQRGVKVRDAGQYRRQQCRLKAHADGILLLSNMSNCSGASSVPNRGLRIPSGIHEPGKWNMYLLQLSGAQGAPRWTRRAQPTRGLSA